MISDADQRLRAWVKSVVRDVEVTLDAPEGRVTKDQSSIGLYLMDVAQVPMLRGGRSSPPIQLALRYLVSAQAPAIEEAHRLLGELIVAAIAGEDLEVEAESPALELWRAFGIPPRPAFILKTMVRKERAENTPPSVRQPVIVQAAPAVNLSGVITGPGDVPIMGARVEYPAANRHTHTDYRGTFLFTTVPFAAPADLLVTVKGKQLKVQADQQASAGEKIRIRWDGQEK